MLTLVSYLIMQLGLFVGQLMGIDYLSVYQNSAYSLSLLVSAALIAALARYFDKAKRQLYLLAFAMGWLSLCNKIMPVIELQQVKIPVQILSIALTIPVYLTIVIVTIRFLVYYRQLIEPKRASLNLVMTVSVTMLSVLQILHYALEGGTLSWWQIAVFVIFYWIDLLLIMVTLTVLMYLKANKSNRLSFLLLMGFTIFIIAHSLSVLSIIIQFKLFTYLMVAKSLMLIAVTLITSSLIYYRKLDHRGTLLTPKAIFYQNISTHYAWLMALLPMILYSGRLINSISLVFSLMVIISLQSARYYNEKTEIIFALRERELLTRDLLQVKVSEKTKELIEINRILEEKTKIDTLTDLKNRFYLKQQIEFLSQKPAPRALIYLDLDRFKIINDLHGHIFGDLILQIIAKRILAVSPESLEFCRIGGDEFVALTEIVSRDKLIKQAKKISAVIRQPIEVSGLVLTLNVSIGIARYPADVPLIDYLLDDAEVAMYISKSRSDDDKIVFYTESQAGHVKRINALEIALKRADLRRDFILLYKPICHLTSNTIEAVEVRIKWQHPQFGLVSANEFMPIAEQIGLIADISEWILFNAVEQLAQWKFTYGLSLRLHVRLSAQLFSLNNFSQLFDDAVMRFGIQYQQICIEISERDLMRSFEISERVINILKTKGIKIAIGDFGRGRTSFSVLNKINFDYIMVAKTFVERIDVSSKDVIILESLLLMARSFNCQSMVNSVNRLDQLSILKHLDCKYALGSVIGDLSEADVFEENYLKGQPLSSSFQELYSPTHISQDRSEW